MRRQRSWDPSRDLPWDQAENLSDIRRGAEVPAFDFVFRSVYWRRLPERRREAFRVESFDAIVCQLIHCEALALKVARTVESSQASSRVRAEASATADEERRHHRAFILYRKRVLRRAGPLRYADWFDGLVRLIEKQPDWELKVLALQGSSERLFLKMIERLRASWKGPVLRELLDVIIREERAHCARGHPIVPPSLSRGERERYLFDVCRAMTWEFPRDVFLRAGLDADACLDLYREYVRAGRVMSKASRPLDVLKPSTDAAPSVRLAHAALELL